GRPEHMGMAIAGAARHLEGGRRRHDAENFFRDLHHTLISCSCLAFSVMAASRNWMSVPVETMRAPMAMKSATSFGRVDSPPTPTCLPCLRQAAMVQA